MSQRNVLAPFGDNYPAMSRSEWENAPFNQEEPEEKNFECDVTETLTRHCIITTNDYEPSYLDGEQVSMCNPEEEYREQCYSLLSLIDELKSRVKKELSEVKDSCKAKSLKRLLKACEGWSQYELEVAED